MGIIISVALSKGRTSELQDTDKHLASLLEIEDIRYSVFKHLEKDGLQECRQVCREWNERCKAYPVELNSITASMLTNLSHKFPNATSINIKGDIVSIDETIEQLLRFGNLKHLGLAMDRHQFCPLYWDWYWYSLRGLTSLDIRRSQSDWPKGFYTALRYLTNLTSLKLISDPISASTPKQPITELKKIEHLEIGTGQIATDQEFMFPSLTNLTHLHFHGIPGNQAIVVGDVLEMALKHRGTIRSLNISLYERLRPSRIEDILPRFRRLECLVLPQLASTELASTDFMALTALSGCTTITRLEIGSCNSSQLNLRKPQISEAVFSLINLRSLKLCDLVEANDHQNQVGYPFSQLLHLKELRLRGGHFGRSLRCLTELVSLDIRTYWTNYDDFVSTLAAMPNLESLSISSLNSSTLPSYIFSRMQKLKALQMEAVRSDKELFENLESLHELTKLKFCQAMTLDYGSGYLLQLTRLRQLRDLSLVCDTNCSPLSFFKEGGFPNLRYLSAGFLSKDDTSALKQRLPRLRKLNAARLDQ